MIRLALAASVLALAAAAHATPPPAKHPPAAKHARPGPKKPDRTVRAVIVSGDGQSAHAYVANGVKRYEAEFAHTLVVRVPDQPYRKGFFHVIFTCITNCTFAPADQPDDGNFVYRVKHGDDESENAYDARVHNGVAALGVVVSSPVIRTVTVRADPVVQKGERAVPASFVLSMH